MFKITMKIAGAGLMLACALPAQEPQQSIRIERRAAGPNVNQTFEFVGGQLLGGKTVKGVPYSAEAVTQSTQTLGDGSHIVNSSSSMIYRDSEGRERREESIAKLGAWSAQGQPAKAVFISDPVANVSYSLDAVSKTARKMPHGIAGGITGGITTKAVTGGAFGMAGAIIPPPAGAGTVEHGQQVFFYSTTGRAGEEGSVKPKVENLGTSTIEGVEAEGTRTTVTIPAGQIGNERDINVVSERWYSPELQVVILSKHSDPRMGESVYKLTNINRSEPLPSMFQVPPDYTVTDSPSFSFDKQSPKKDNEQ